jgi:hypothetical protein
MALGSTQPLTEMSTRNPPGVKYDINDRNYVLLVEKRRRLFPARLMTFHFVYVYYTYCHMFACDCRRALDW